MKTTHRKTFLLAGLAAGLFVLPVYAAAPGHISRRQRKVFRGVNYAHRGLHSRDKQIPENSLAARRPKTVMALSWMFSFPKTEKSWCFMMTRWTGSAEFMPGWMT